ncbi:hypothetical protein FBU31_001052, partial [Coemansia sp. 'formosensis']
MYWMLNSNYCHMTYRNITPVKIKDLAHAYVSAIDQIHKLLDELLKPIVSTKLPPLKDLIDCRNDPNNPAAFLIHLDNNFGQHQRTLFHAHVKQETFLSSPTPSRASTYKLTTWLSKVAKLIDFLLFTMHLSGGQPVRAPELNSLMVHDWEHQQCRLYIINDHMAMTTWYWKGRALHGKDKHVLRLLPVELGDLLLKYLVFIKPCEVMAVNELYSSQPSDIRKKATVISHYYLFTQNGKHIGDDQVCSIFASVWSEQAGYKLTFQDMQHIMQAFLMSNAHKFRTSVSSDLVPDDGSDRFDAMTEYMHNLDAAQASIYQN